MKDHFYEKTCRKCMYSGKTEDQFRVNVGLKVNEKSYFCPTCNKNYPFKKWIHCWWHNYTFRHLLRDFGSNNPVPYWNCGQKLINAGLLDYLHDSDIEYESKEYVKCTFYELEGIIEYMNPNVKIYKDNGLCSDDERNNIRFKDLSYKDNVSKISIVGAGMVTTPGVTYKMFRALAEEKINILAISTSEIKISVIIEEELTVKAVKKLHNIFNLD